MKFMYFSIKYRYSDILLKNIHFIYNRFCCCNHTCKCGGMVAVTSASSHVTSALSYQRRSSMFIRGLMPLDATEMAEAVPIGMLSNLEIQADRTLPLSKIK